VSDTFRKTQIPWHHEKQNNNNQEPRKDSCNGDIVGGPYGPGEIFRGFLFLHGGVNMEEKAKSEIEQLNDETSWMIEKIQFLMDLITTENIHLIPDIVEDVIQNHGTRISTINEASNAPG
jgi:hypothetical protein